MGKATIIAPKGAGLYEVAINYDTAAYAARVAALTASLASLDSQLATLAAQISTAKGDKDYCLGLLNEAIAAKDLPYIKSTESELIKANAVWMGLRQTETIFKSRRLAASKALETLQATPPADRLVDAWCADASEDLSGIVGTIDPAGVDSNTLLRPGFSGQAAYAQARDGLYRQREHMGPAEVFYNAAMLPGWQKWTPTYRVGTITALAGDNCDVLLDPVVSDAQGLDVNQSSTLAGVGIAYMDCHGAAFAVGDTVVVMFTGQAWANPQVIGFERNPQECRRSGFNFHQSAAAPWSAAPLALLSSASGWKVETVKVFLSGNIDWQGYAGTLTWDGPPSRYWHVENSMAHVIQPIGKYYGQYSCPGTARTVTGTDNVNQSGQANIYKGGRIIAQINGGMVTSATLSPDGKRCMVTAIFGVQVSVGNIGYRVNEYHRILPERVYFFDLAGDVVPVTAMRLSTEFTEYGYHADFAASYHTDSGPLSVAQVKALLAPMLTRVWRMNASGTIGITERMGTRQTMAINWSNETVTVTAGISAHKQTKSWQSVQTCTELSTGNWTENEVTVPFYSTTLKNVSGHTETITRLLLCDWVGDTLVEGEVRTELTVTATFGPGQYERLVTETRRTYITMDGVVVIDVPLSATDYYIFPPGSTTKTRTAGVHKIYLQGIDLRARAISLDVWTCPPTPGSGAQSLQNITTIAGVTTTTAHPPFVATMPPILPYVGVPDGPDFSYTFESYTPSGLSGGQSVITASLEIVVAALTDRSWWAAENLTLAPHNGQGLRGSAIVPRIVYVQGVAEVQIVAEIPAFPCTGAIEATALTVVGNVIVPPTYVADYNYEYTTFLRRVINVPTGTLPATKNWSRIDIL